ncbi:MAG: hypothetical protein V1837_03340 [Candidatus Woesearchaeota archaeon]
MLSAYEIDAYKVQRFLRFISLAYKKREDSESTKQELLDHIQKIKVSCSKPKQSESIKEDLKELEAKLELALEKQATVVRHDYHHDSFSRELLKTITALDKRIESYLTALEKRDKRVKELEAKIKKR